MKSFYNIQLIYKFHNEYLPTKDKAALDSLVEMIKDAYPHTDDTPTGKLLSNKIRFLLNQLDISTDILPSHLLYEYPYLNLQYERVEEHTKESLETRLYNPNIAPMHTDISSGEEVNIYYQVENKSAILVVKNTGERKRISWSTGEVIID